MLQAVLFGYGGIRIRKSQLDINPVLFPNVSIWSMNGLNYKGFEFDIEVNKSHNKIFLHKSPEQHYDLTARTENQQVVILKINQLQEFPTGKLVLKETSKIVDNSPSNRFSNAVNYLSSLQLILCCYMLFSL